MGMRTGRWACTLAAGLVLAACGGGGGAPAEPEGPPQSLVLGLVPSAEVDQLVLDADQLAALISAELGIPVEPVVSESYAALVVAMQTGQADIGLFGPIALVQSVDQAGAVPILQSVRRDSPSYHTQWMTNDPAKYCTTPVVQAPNPEGNQFTFCNGTDTATEGPVGEEAIGKIVEGDTVMFVDESSASGYYYPATQIQEITGIDPLTGIDAQFAGGHPNSVLAVARGDVPVGVSFDDARNDVFEEDPEIGSKVTVFAWSPEIPNDGVSVRGELPEETRTAIADAMTAVIGTPEGAAAFDAVYSIEGLVPADLEQLDVARQVAANFGG
ncbi:phosphate/phosphite/phosphonate ABC transporter substrate-binding protein [Pseudonocardia saturnea]